MFRCSMFFIVLLYASLLAFAQGQHPLKIAVGPSGLSSVKYNGQEVVSDGTFRVAGVFFRKWDGSTFPGDTTRPKITLDRSTRRVKFTYPWGSVASSYTVEGNKLTLVVDIVNATVSDTIAALHLQLMDLKLAATPKDLGDKPKMGHNMGSLTMIGVDDGVKNILLCNDGIGRPLAFGVAPATDAGKTVFPVLAFTGRHSLLPNVWPFIDRPVYPGGVDRYILSFRFGPAGAPVETLSADLEKKFAQEYPFRLTWKDHRPIAALFLANSNMKWLTNPRGWFNDKSLDITTPKGLSEFHDRLMQLADDNIRIMKDMDAQGMIVWDPEGGEYPHPTTYLGDPRSLPKEMDTIADEYFKKFRDAGFRTGICIRPQRPVRPAYGDTVFQLTLQDPGDRKTNVNGKIAEAQKRWGCTIFYLDSNSYWYDDPFIQGIKQGYSGKVLDDNLLRQLMELHPDILLIPEAEGLQTYAYAAPYIQLNYDKLASTPASVNRVYPQAFSVQMAIEGPMDERHDELVAAVKRGDILLFRAFNDPYNAKVKSIYEDAKK